MAWPPIGELDTELDRILRVLKIEHVVDVGAHKGGFARRLRSTGFRGQILSFEPTPESFDQLRKAAGKDPLWTARCAALGSSDGTKTLTSFNVGGGEYNSFRHLSQHAGAYDPRLAPAGTTEVPVSRLDSLWEQTGFNAQQTLLKSDTQGFDLEVIAGAGSLMNALPAVLMEVSVTPLYDGAPIMTEVLQEMSRLGFELTGAFPIHRHGNGLRVIEFDCTFVNIAVERPSSAPLEQSTEPFRHPSI